MTTTIDLQYDEIHIVEGRNPRLGLLGIEELAESILENGVISPITVQARPTGDGVTFKYTLVDGHRRVAACEHLHQTRDMRVRIPAFITQCKQEAEVLVLMMVANDSVPFMPVEEAKMFARLKDEFKYTTDAISQAVGKSPSYISDRLALLRAAPTLQDVVRDGTITASDANTIIRKSRGDVDAQRETARRVLEEGREQVIDKELKKGRMPKAAWAVAATAYDQLFQAGLDAGDANAVSAALAQPDPPDHIATLPITPAQQAALAFYAGKLSGFAELSHLTPTELWHKIEERNNF